MNGRFQGSCGGRGPAGGGNRVEVRVDTAFWSSRVTSPVEVVAVRHSSSVFRPVERRIAIVGWLLATCASFALLAPGVAAADMVTTNFETFQLGSVNGQDGWKSDVPGDIPSLPHGYDQAVVATSGARPGVRRPIVAPFKRIRHGPGHFSPEYELQTYSKPTANAAGDSSGQYGVHRPVLVHFLPSRPSAAEAPHLRQPGQWPWRTDVLHRPGRYGGRHPCHFL